LTLEVAANSDRKFRSTRAALLATSIRIEHSSAVNCMPAAHPSAISDLA
jgi:hypothetical protein